MNYCRVWWPMVAEILVIITVPIANPWVQSFIGLKKISHHENLLASMSLYTHGLSWLVNVCCQVTTTEHAANNYDSQLHFWTNWWASLYFPSLKWIKWGRRVHSSISIKVRERNVGPKGSYSLFQLLLKAILTCETHGQTVSTGQGWVKALCLLLGLSYSLKTLLKLEIVHWSW